MNFWETDLVVFFSYFLGIHHDIEQVEIHIRAATSPTKATTNTRNGRTNVQFA